MCDYVDRPLSQSVHELQAELDQDVLGKHLGTRKNSRQTRRARRRLLVKRKTSEASARDAPTAAQEVRDSGSESSADVQEAETSVTNITDTAINSVLRLRIARFHMLVFLQSF